MIDIGEEWLGDTYMSEFNMQQFVQSHLIACYYPLLYIMCPKTSGGLDDPRLKTTTHNSKVDFVLKTSSISFIASYTTSHLLLRAITYIVSFNYIVSMAMMVEKKICHQRINAV